MLIRVFVQRTSHTPDDDLVRFDVPTLFDEADEVHVSCLFSWDKPRAEYLAEQWRTVTSNVQIGGPAYGDPGGEFTPGLYLRRGYVITSRGCPNKCWFCDVHRREGGIRELQINDGHIVLDSNLLATSRNHQVKVFEMLQRQAHRPKFSGGIEAALFTDWHAEWMMRLKPEAMWFAYDTPNDYEPLVNAGATLARHGYKTAWNSARCYVLIGYKGDTFEKAEQRLIDTIDAGFMPQSMLFNKRDDAEWIRFHRNWANPWVVGSKISKIRKEVA